MQSVCVYTTGKNLPGVRLHGVVRAGQAGNGIEENHHVLAVLHHAPSFFDNHFSHLHVPLGRLVKGGAHDLRSDTGALHIGHFLRPLVNEQDDEVGIRVILQHGVGKLLHEHRLAGPRRGHD